MEQPSAPPPPPPPPTAPPPAPPTNSATATTAVAVTASGGQHQHRRVSIAEFTHNGGADSARGSISRTSPASRRRSMSKARRLQERRVSTGPMAGKSTCSIRPSTEGQSSREQNKAVCAANIQNNLGFKFSLHAHENWVKFSTAPSQASF